MAGAQSEKLHAACDECREWHGRHLLLHHHAEAREQVRGSLSARESILLVVVASVKKYNAFTLRRNKWAGPGNEEERISCPKWSR